jgi:hypothetical protein
MYSGRARAAGSESAGCAVGSHAKRFYCVVLVVSELVRRIQSSYFVLPGVFYPITYGWTRIARDSVLAAIVAVCSNVSTPQLSIRTCPAPR